MEEKMEIENLSSRYGELYWFVSVPKSVAEKGEFTIHADRVETHPNGSLAFYGGYRKYYGDKPENESLLLLLSLGNWNYVYVASVLDGSAVATEYWEQGLGG